MTYQNNNINYQGYFPYCGPMVSGGKWVKANALNAASGDNDLYTVPTGKKAIVYNISVFNTTAGSVLSFSKIKISGNYYKISAGNSTAAGTFSNIILSNNLNTTGLIAGDTITVNCASTGQNVFGEIWEFEDSVPILFPRIINLSNGANTLYTCPSGKSALLTTGQGVAYLNSTDSSVKIWNATGSNIGVQVNIVNNGDPVTTDNQVYSKTGITGTGLGTGVYARINGVCLGAGDSVVVSTNSGTTGQNAYCTIWEMTN